MREKIIEKALKDPKFREALKKDAAAAIEKEFGVKAPAGVVIKVVEDDATAVHLVIPPPAAKGAISDKDLGNIAGGACSWATCADASTAYRSA